MPAKPRQFIVGIETIMNPDPASAARQEMPPFPFASAGDELARNLGIGIPRPLFNWLTAIDQAAEVWKQVHTSSGPFITDRILSALGVEFRCTPSDLDRIPATGRVVLVSNHPFGLLDGMILSSLVHRRRPDFRVIANQLLASFAEVRDFIIPVNVLSEGVQANGQALRTALKWVHSGGALIIFPAGEVSSPHGMPPAIVDREWNEGVLRLAVAAKAPVVPVYVSGRNSAAFQCAGFVHPMLRTAMLNRELMNKRGRVVDVAVGRPIPAARLAELDEQGLAEYVRKRTYLLAERRVHFAMPLLRKEQVPDPVAAQVDSALLAADVAALPAESLLVRGGGYAVCVARAQQLPNILPEIGRLREVTFRAVGEGTGRAADLDSFDREYEHLFVWSERKNEVVGAYRIAKVDETVRRFGPRGLYTTRLFQVKPEFLERVAKGLELGRSFVRLEYQRSLHPLYSLWKGIGAYLGRNPSYRYLFGPVSISNGYSRAARELMVQFFRQQMQAGNAVVRARKPFRARALGARFLLGLAQGIEGVQELSDFVADLEPDGKGVPVLLRHYLGLGAEILEFNVDPAFANALDALIVVDLMKSNPAVLEKYMGTEVRDRYLAHH